MNKLKITIIALILLFILAGAGSIYTFSRVIITSSSGNEVEVNSDGQMHVVMQGKVDTGNSTESLLLGGESFTGTGIDVSEFSAITIMIAATDTAVNGGILRAQFSNDNSTWVNGESYSIVSGAEKFFTPPVQANYFRILYTNGAGDQTAFCIHTMLKKSPIKWSSHNLQGALNDEDDGELVVSIPKLRTAQNTYVSAAATNSGNHKVSLEELESGISSNSNSQLNVTPFHADGTEGNLITGVDYVSGKSGIDANTEWQIGIDGPHHEIHEGRTFRVQVNSDSIASSGDVSISFFVPDQAREPHMTWEFVHQGDMSMILYEGTTVTVSTGTDLTCKNSYRASTNTSILQGTSTGSLVSGFVTTNATYSGGDLISLKRNYAAKNQASGGSRRNEVILKTNTYYTFVLLNNEVSSQGGQIRLEWYEHAPKN